jgi:hypothetical protein
MLLPKNTISLMRPLDQTIIQAFKAYYRWALLMAAINSELQVPVPENSYTFTLKNMTYSIRLAWKNISSMTIKNCWSKCITATGNNIKHEEEFLGFTEEDACEASNTLHDRRPVSLGLQR